MTRDERVLRRAVERLAELPAEERRWLVGELGITEKRTLNEFWPAWAHDGQEPPPGDWPVWLMLTGRGFGKTRAGAEWVSGLARGAGTMGTVTSDGPLRIALVGATIEDARKVMVSGRSGLLAVARTGEHVTFAKTDGIVRFPSGAEAFLYSGADPEKLRGPEHHFAWCDEIAKWRHPEETWDNLQLGLRLGPLRLPACGSRSGQASTGSGQGPRTLVTTTPKAVPLLRRLVATSVVTRGRAGARTGPTRWSGR